MKSAELGKNYLQNSTGYRSLLNGVRAIAILLVVFHHYGVPGVPTLGVAISFVLSGFVVTCSLLQELQRTQTICLKSFFKRRARRILPLFYFYLILVTGFMWLGGITFHWDEIAATFFFGMDYFRALTGSELPQGWITWSLDVEFKFYLLWPILLYCLRNRLKTLAAWSAGGIAAIAIYRVILVEIYHVKSYYIYNAFETRVDGILLGCLLAICLDQKIGMKFLHCLAKKPWYGAFPVGAIAACIVIPGYVPTSENFHEEVGILLIPIFIALFMGQMICSKSFGCFKWLSSKPLMFISAISYGLYLLHIPIHQAFWAAFPGQSAVFRALAPMAATGMAAYGISTLPALFGLASTGSDRFGLAPVLSLLNPRSPSKLNPSRAL